MRGIPRMNASMDGLETVERSFGYEWTAQDEGRFEQDTLFGRTADEAWEYFLEGLMIDAPRARRAIVLDAGCGPGFFTRSIAEHGAELVIGVDINEAVDVAAASCRGLDNVQLVQANLLSLPFRRDTFDLAWCVGVLHHTPEPQRGHRCLARCVKPGGVLFVWVYDKRFDPLRFTRDVLQRLGVRRLAPPRLMLLSKLLAYVSLAPLWMYRRLRVLPGLRPGSVRGERTVRPRSLREMHLRWFDTLSPEYDSRHTVEEVTGWFDSVGFTDIHPLHEPRVGVRGMAPSPPAAHPVEPAMSAGLSSSTSTGRGPMPDRSVPPVETAKPTTDC